MRLREGGQPGDACPRGSADDDRARNRGGLVGGYVASNLLKIGTVDGINVESIVIAPVGAIAIIFVVHLATGSRGMLSRR